jgi:putative phosphoserine phosphatase/1-acylglycerol-3-phosphate O-acyltransferase
VLVSSLEVVDGMITGELVFPLCYGEGKAVAARGLAEVLDIDLAQSWFYTDSEEDLPLLEAVGKPRPTNPSRNLATIAARRRWPTQHFVSRGFPGAEQMLRTGLAIGSLLPCFILGLPVAALNGNWQEAVNIMSSTWGELGSALAGLDLHVRGEEHVWSRRPAVFIFNHQSAIDMLVICKLLRRDFVGIGKQELKRNPIFGPLMTLAGTVFVDRFHHEKAIQALRPAIDALRQGLSLAIAPEGTRSTTPHPGPFKKGAFFMAMEAGVPIVPIVLRNTIDALPKNWLVVRPTTIDVDVLPPIDTGSWRRQDLDRHIAATRDLYTETLRTAWA